MIDRSRTFLLYFFFTLFFACHSWEGEEQAFLKDPDAKYLKQVAALLNGHWKMNASEGVRFRFGDDPRGSRTAYSFKGEKKTGTASFLTPVELRSIDKKVALVSKKYEKDTSFIQRIDEKELVLQSGKKRFAYEKHEGISY